MKWEYMVLEQKGILKKETLDSYGEDGWELVSVTVMRADYNHSQAYFKRQIEAERESE